MAHNNPDWLIFLDHVSALRRRVGLRRIQPTDVLHNFTDPQAYVQALSDIIDAQYSALEAFREVDELVAQWRDDNPFGPWRQREIDVLWRADASRVHQGNALQRFTTEQYRIRPNVVLNPDPTTIPDWIERLVDETRAWEHYISELLVQALDGSAAPESRSSSAVVSNRGDQAAGPADQGDEEDEDEQSAARQSANGSGSSGEVGGKKRSRGRGDDPESNGSHRSKKISRPNESPERVISEESRSSNDIPLHQLPPLEQEVDPLQKFDSKWQTFRDEWSEQDRPTWERLYARARRLVKAHLPAIFPEDLSAAAMADFRVQVNTALETVLGWDWEEHVDHIRNAEAGLYQEGDVQQAELAREAIMQKARGGQSPIWPPTRKTPPGPLAPPPGSPIDDVAQTRVETANALASDLIHKGDSQQAGEWCYLITVGQGTYGEAQLWTAVRSDDHGMIVEVSVHLRRMEQVVVTLPDSAMLAAWSHANVSCSASS